MYDAVCPLLLPSLAACTTALAVATCFASAMAVGEQLRTQAYKPMWPTS